MSGGAWIRVGSVLGFLAVAIGAFGAHGLKARLDALGTAATFHTGVEYHFYHTLAIVMLGLMCGPSRTQGASSVAGWAFLIGVLLFSGSIYVLSITGVRKLGMITPFGGLCFLVGWVSLFLAAASGSFSGPPSRP